MFVQPVFSREAPKIQEQVLYSLGNGTDGRSPYSNVKDVDGALYGTTYSGGTDGMGTLFSVNQSTGAETVLHSFIGGTTDGRYPFHGVLAVKGILYGTTEHGGPQDRGTVFAFDPNTGVEKVAYFFCTQAESCPDGQYPTSGLIDVNGTLYGTTEQGGNFGWGTVFSLDPNTGAEKVLYSFHGTEDGAWPEATLIHVDGALYGTTQAGGAIGYGSVFSINLKNDEETLLHSFTGGTDGARPFASLINVKGTLFGTTYGGGTPNDGVVFSIDPSTGAETVLHSFGSGADGQNPYANLIDVKGALYGTTYNGGANGDGTVFSIDPSTGVESVMYSFQGSPDGQNPYAGLIDKKNALYGTTLYGGIFRYGAVFVLKKP